MERFFALAAFKREGTKVKIGTDASPWGLGGWISINDRITEYFACRVTPADVERYGHPIGSANGQQIWECLAILVAVDLWEKYWTDSRVMLEPDSDSVILQVTGDNVTALTMLVKMRPNGPKMAIIARELALRLAKQSFPPDALHTPGIGHKIADELSRIFAPGHTGVADSTLHPMLAGATRVTPPVRNDDFYRAMLHEPAFYKIPKAEGDGWGSWN